MSQVRAEVALRESPAATAQSRRGRLAEIASHVFRNRLSVLGLCGVLLLLLIAVFGPLVAPYDPAAPSPARLQSPTMLHLMGTDNLGRDVFSRFLFGTRVSLFVSLGAVTLGLVAGTLLGMVAGLRAGGVWDMLTMRGMDVVL